MAEFYEAHAHPNGSHSPRCSTRILNATLFRRRYEVAHQWHCICLYSNLLLPIGNALNLPMLLRALDPRSPFPTNQINMVRIEGIHQDVDKRFHNDLHTSLRVRYPSFIVRSYQ